MPCRLLDPMGNVWSVPVASGWWFGPGLASGQAPRSRSQRSGLRFRLAVLLCERPHVVDQVPILFRLDARPFGGHLVMAILDDVEDFAVGTVFQSCRIGKVRGLQLHFFCGLALAVAVLAVTHLAIERPPLLGAGQGFRCGLHRIGLLSRFHGNGGIRWRFGRGGVRTLLREKRTRRENQREENESGAVHGTSSGTRSRLRENCSTPAKEEPLLRLAGIGIQRQILSARPLTYVGQATK